MAKFVVATDHAADGGRKVMDWISGASIHYTGGGEFLSDTLRIAYTRHLIDKDLECI